MIELTLLALFAALVIVVAGQRIENSALKRLRDYKDGSARKHPFMSPFATFPIRVMRNKIGKTFEAAGPIDSDGAVITRKRP